MLVEERDFNVSFDSGTGFTVGFGGGSVFNGTFDEAQDVTVSFDSGGVFAATLDASDDFGSGFGETELVHVSDHRELTHRNATEQHPISAITDLVSELADRPDAPIPDSFIDNL